MTKFDDDDDDDDGDDDDDDDDNDDDDDDGPKWIIDNKLCEGNVKRRKLR